ncbi:hypothetical protein MTBBW1_2500017 [Desulfamplus magnetovallimortis]|uniref:Uncharacterized protein n=1 Tax=Desulfamplus magnetovallimortis TaxID=1246637 RepID=A0A1W1HEQ0_9BACT|nr:hypothetical protein [Desulfamplus magnetovallimortis]SLM30868.1 hypothetical protein MTBBW1_2500017 [Desulfamplus magnetovallimortis]
MGYYSAINGFIKGISEDSFDLIKEDLKQVFENVDWYDNMIEISSYAKHYSATVNSVYDKIAFCVDTEDGGTLEEEGDEHFDFSVIFFAPRQWKQLWIEFKYPPNPFLKPLESTS